MNYPNVQLYIDGKWRPAASGKTIPVLNPATEEVVGTVAHAGKADLDEALAAADKGFKVWRAMSAYDRSKVMRKAADLIRERAEKRTNFLIHVVRVVESSCNLFAQELAIPPAEPVCGGAGGFVG